MRRYTSAAGVSRSPAADTVIKCIVTGYQPKTIHRSERKVGLKDQKIQTWIGNIEASVHVLDGSGHPLDAANLKHHLENDFVVSEQEEKAASLTDKRASWRDKVAGAVKPPKAAALVAWWVWWEADRSFRMP